MRRKTFPSGAGETRGTHTAPNRPPATPVSTQNMNGWVKARSNVLQGAGSLIASIRDREAVVSEQAPEHLQ